MSGKSFHLRANEVRAEAQALMQKLRAERFAASRAGRRAMRLNAKGAEAEAPASFAMVEKPGRILASRKVRAVTEAVESVVAQAVADATPVLEVPAIEAPASAKARKRRSRKPVGQPAVVEACVDYEPVAPAKPARKPRAKKAAAPVPATDPNDCDASAIDEVVAAAIPDVSPPAPGHRAMMPISLVPSLGPGMIWHLNQLGLHTLQDLADHSPDQLRGKLGPVARLVRVENWIAFARAA
jgi:hypothetical protein